MVAAQTREVRAEEVESGVDVVRVQHGGAQPAVEIRGLVHAAAEGLHESLRRQRGAIQRVLAGDGGENALGEVVELAADVGGHELCLHVPQQQATQVLRAKDQVVRRDQDGKELCPVPHQHGGSHREPDCLHVVRGEAPAHAEEQHVECELDGGDEWGNVRALHERHLSDKVKQKVENCASKCNTERTPRAKSYL